MAIMVRIEMIECLSLINETNYALKFTLKNDNNLSIIFQLTCAMLFVIITFPILCSFIKNIILCYFL